MPPPQNPLSSHPWQDLDADEKMPADMIEKQTTRGSLSDDNSGKGIGGSSGRAAAVKRGTADEIPIEMTDRGVPEGIRPTSGTGAGSVWLTFSPVAGHAARYFDTTETVINWLSTAFLFAFTFITPVVIYVLHLGPKKSIIVSAALVLAGNWIRYAGSHSKSGGKYGVVMFGQILTGLAQPFVLAAPTRYSDLWFTNRGRVAATALASLANPFGAAIGQLIIPFWVQEPSDISHMVLYVSIILSLRASAKILFSHLEFWLLFIPFAIYVGLFNSISSLLNQILLPHGYNEEEAGIAGALLIVVGLP
ncbi:hypothetical protein N0V88_005313 [Collariella sp. IMI 366227]|nr:hypothetical protein N0V88_005313 [Collariella sp. IMI 366227]